MSAEYGAGVTSYQGSHLTSQPVNHSAIRGSCRGLISQSETSMDDSWPIRSQAELVRGSLNLARLDAGDVMIINSMCDVCKVTGQKSVFYPMKEYLFDLLYGFRILLMVNISMWFLMASRLSKNNRSSPPGWSGDLITVEAARLITLITHWFAVIYYK